MKWLLTGTVSTMPALPWVAMPLQFNCLAIHPCGTLIVNIWEVLKVFFFDEVFLTLVPLVHCWWACLTTFLPLWMMAPPGALQSACLQLHQLFLWAHMACLRIMHPLLSFELPLTSFSSSWVFVVCNGHTIPSNPILHHPLDPMVWCFLELLA